MTFKILLFITLQVLLVSMARPQGVAINATGNPADSSAALDITYTNKGVLFPRMTTAQRDAIVNPANGLFIYNTDCNVLNYNAGTPSLPNWVAVNASPTMPGPAGTITGPALVCQGQSGVAYSVPVIPNANTYNWNYTGNGATISGSSNAITISFSGSATSGNLTVSGANNCGSGMVSPAWSITVTSLPATPAAGSHTAAQTQIQWNWTAVPGATEYFYGTVNNFALATSNGASTSFSQTGLACSTAYVLYVWAYNLCGPSPVLILSQNTLACGGSPTSYPTGNAAYWTERNLGFNNVTIGGGSAIYTYDPVNKQYVNGNSILIPNLVGTPNGQTVNATSFYGFNGGTPDNNGYHWDANPNPVVAQPNQYDVVKMFISPVSADMNFCQAMNYYSPNCGSTVIDGPDSTLAYPSASPQSGTYDLTAGTNLINAGNIIPSDPSRISQQQLDPASVQSYCVCTYGKGWRIPTDIEMGHAINTYGWGKGTDAAYNAPNGSLNYHLWSTAIWPTGGNYMFIYWPLGTPQNGYWDGNGVTMTNQKVRCVYPGN